MIVAGEHWQCVRRNRPIFRRCDGVKVKMTTFTVWSIYDQSGEFKAQRQSPEAAKRWADDNIPAS